MQSGCAQGSSIDPTASVNGCRRACSFGYGTCREGHIKSLLRNSVKFAYVFTQPPTPLHPYTFEVGEFQASDMVEQWMLYLLSNSNDLK